MLAVVLQALLIILYWEEASVNFEICLEYSEVCRTGKCLLRLTVKFAVSGHMLIVGQVGSTEQGHTRAPRKIVVEFQY